jgi:hypothetical protein
MNLSPYALTTLANVKSRLGIQNTSSDTQLTATINAATDFIERECGKSGPERYPNDGHFIQKTYTNEVYTVRGSKQIYLPLRNAPVLYLIVTGNLTANSAVVTNVTPSNGIAAGMPLYAIDGLFPQDTVVASVGDAGTSVTMSAARECQRKRPRCSRSPASFPSSGAPGTFLMQSELDFDFIQAAVRARPAWAAPASSACTVRSRGFTTTWSARPIVAGYRRRLAERRATVQYASAPRPTSRTSARTSWFGPIQTASTRWQGERRRSKVQRPDMARFKLDALRSERHQQLPPRRQHFLNFHATEQHSPLDIPNISALQDCARALSGDLDADHPARGRRGAGRTREVHYGRHRSRSSTGNLVQNWGFRGGQSRGPLLVSARSATRRTSSSAPSRTRSRRDNRRVPREYRRPARYFGQLVVNHPGTKTNPVYRTHTRRRAI